MKKTHVFFFIAIALAFSCNNKKYEDFNPDEFYEVTGVIININPDADFFSGEAGLNVHYHYFINDTTYYKGFAEKINLPLIYRGIGAPVKVKVLTKNPKINFYWEGGVANDLTPKKIEIIEKHVDSIYYARMKKKHEFLKKEGLDYNKYYLNDSLRN
ncbi:hypothetical protein AAON49_12050 [Pseudotenacibaculum sp. MALMAid0570]|uniref:hypothetical protein n=1 Tax=Pseudotenacibaculum sp. MALMAid0570 TaxID=3143938 RepID=UPI0032DF39D0